MSSPFEIAINDHDVLGEGPWWSPRDGVLWRVDILGQTLHSWNPVSGASEHWPVGEDLGFAVPTSDGRLVLGLRSGIAIFDPATGEQEPLIQTPGSAQSRFNDGKTDRQGRVWAGTIVDDLTVRNGVFGRLDANDFHIGADDLGISNGLGWSPDNATMYLTDSAIGTIWAYDFDSDTARMTNRRTFAVDNDCEPDGLTVDAEGGVWSAKWDGGRVVRYDADGVISEVVEIPVSRPTSCSFGGPGLDTLFVTSASVGLDEDECASTGAGAVFAMTPGVIGIAETEARVD